ncbi:MAG: hypothetical protein ACYDGR_09450 [Candidatus Dormibacteria bacterium]
MPRTPSGPVWAEGSRLAGHIALALSESIDDRVRLRRVLQQVTETAPREVLVPSGEDVARDIRATIALMREESPEPRRGELLHLMAIEGLPRKEAADRVFLSERQFYRVRQEAVEELADRLSAAWRGRRQAVGRTVPRSFHGASERIPMVRNFVGRVAELEEAIEILRGHGMLLLGGPPGVGKTSMGTQVAQVESSRYGVIWHRFREGISDSPSAVLLTIGSALAEEGDGRLQQMLEQATTHPLWLPGAVELAKRGLNERNWLVCFDDTDVIVESEPCCGLIQLLYEECPESRFLLMGRSGLWRLPNVQGIALAGLGIDEVIELLRGFQVAELPRARVEDLLEWSGGSPQLLRLAANVLVQAARPEQTIAALQDEPDVNSFLLNHVFERLKLDERVILKGSSLLRVPVTAAFLARAFKDLADYVPDALTRLAQQFLLASTDGGLRLHSTIRQFCRHQLTADQAVDLNTRLAAAYADDGNPVEAAYHWLEAGAPREAREMLLASGWRGKPVAIREAIADLSGRVLADAPQGEAEFINFYVGVLGSLGREQQARELLRQRSASVHDRRVLLTMAALERDAGDMAAARAALGRLVVGELAPSTRWLAWWESARIERDEEEAEAARRAAARLVKLAGEPDTGLARMAELAINLLPTATRLDLPEELELIDPGLISLAIQTDASSDHGITGELCIALVSRGLPAGGPLLERLKTQPGRPAETIVWRGEGILAAVAGDYRNAAQAAARAADRARSSGRLREAVLGSLNAAVYRAMAGDLKGARGALQAVTLLPPAVPLARLGGVALRLVALREARRAGGSETGHLAPPASAVERALVLISAAMAGAEANLDEAMRIAGGCAMDHRLMLIDLLVEVARRPEWLAERRRLRLPHPGAVTGG